MHISLNEEIWSSDPLTGSGTGLCVPPVASVDDDDYEGVEDDFDDDEDEDLDDDDDFEDDDDLGDDDDDLDEDDDFDEDEDEDDDLDDF